MSRWILSCLRTAGAFLALPMFWSALSGASMAASGAPIGKSKAPLTKLVVIGDSLSAGFQNFSLFTSANGGQNFGFAAVVAQQAGAGLSQPTISYPGIPPALTLNAGQVVRAAGLGTRTNLTQATNLSVPGFTVADAIMHAFPGDPSASNTIDLLSDTILGTPPGALGCGPVPTFLLDLLPLPSSATALIPAGSPFFVSEAACAVGLRPSTIIASIGSNDVLQALTLGTAPTAPNVFETNYHLLMETLALAHANIIAANVPDVTTLPFVVNAAAYLEQCGTGLPAGAAYVVPNLGAPAFDVCTYNIPLTQAQITGLQALVVEYNAIISAEIASQAAHGVAATVVDLNGLLKTLVAQGYDTGGKHLTTAYLGGLFSLDGIHPTNTGYAILANAFIGSMNTALGTNIAPVNIAPIAKSDPLVPGNQ